MGNEGLRALEGKAAAFAATGQIQLLHAQTQLMELHLLQLVHGYASSVANFGLRRFVADELGLLLGLSSRSVTVMIEDAEMLIDHPVLLEKVADGHWSLRHARAALGCLAGSGLDRAQQQQAVALVLSQRARTPWEVRQAMQAALLVIDPEAAARRHDRAVADRGVGVDATDGVGTLFAHGSVSQVRALLAALEAQVGPAGPEETRSRSQRLFDALMDLVCGRAEPGQWQAYVLVTLETLTGASEEPAEIPGLGLISATEARGLAGRAELRRVVVDDRGVLVSIDSAVAKPDATPTAPTPVRLLSSQTEEPVDDAPVEVPAEDLAWLAAHADADEDAHAHAHAAEADAQVDAQTGAQRPAHAGEVAEVAEVEELSDLTGWIGSCPRELDSALEDLLSDALTDLVLTGAVPAASVTFETDGYRHHPPGPPGPPKPGSAPPDPGPPHDRTPGSGGPPPPPSPPPPSPPPTQLGSGPAGQLGPDLPPTDGDLAWADDTTDYTSFDQQVPPRRYQREPGSRRSGARTPTLNHWTPAGLTAALTRMLTRAVDPAPASSSYALPPRMARFVKARDITCQFPICHQLAHLCQNDHINPWPHGKTHIHNIASECVHHHQSKTQKYFTVTKDHHGVHWTTPAGRTYTRHPRPLLRGW